MNSSLCLKKVLIFNSSQQRSAEYAGKAVMIDSHLKLS